MTKEFHIVYIRKMESILSKVGVKQRMDLEIIWKQKFIQLVKNKVVVIV